MVWYNHCGTTILVMTQEGKVNLPADRIHDPLSSYGYLVFPITKRDQHGHRRWLAWFVDYGFRLTDTCGFHNCRATGVF